MKTKNIILGAVLAVIGIIMAAVPETCIKAAVVLVGAAAVAFSVYNLFVVYKQSEDAAFKKTLLIKSICTFIVGLVAVICPFVLYKAIEIIWTVISIVRAVYLILYAGLSVYSSAKLRSNFPLESKRLIFESLIFVAIAVLLIIIPIDTFGPAFVRTVGLGGLLVGLIMIIVEIVVNKRTSSAAEEEKEADIADKIDPQTAAEADSDNADDGSDDEA